MDTKANGPHSSPALDRIDEAIIEVLRHQGRITYEKLSSLVHLTPRPCLERVRKLERRGVIRGYGAIIDVQMVSPGLSLLVLVALSNQSGRSAQKAFEACVKACPQVFECQLISGPFDYSLRMRCRDMEHYRVLTETWLNNDELHIDKLVAHPELAVVKNTDRTGLSPNFTKHCITPVGAGLLANVECQSLNLSLIHRIREQARSHIF